MKNQFGPLAPGDNYFVPFNAIVGNDYGNATANPAESPPNQADTGIAIGHAFLGNVINGVATFIAAAAYDTTIHAPSIADALSDGNFSIIVSSAGYSPTLNPAGLPAERSGGMTLYSNSTPPTSLGEVTMPTYSSGHSVTMRATAAANLLKDVMQWYSKFPN